MASKKGQYYKSLKDKWVDRHREIQKKLWDKHSESLHWLASNSKQLAVGSAAALALMKPVSTPAIPPSNLLASTEQYKKEIDKNIFFMSDLQKVLPPTVAPLTPDQEEKVSEVFSRYFGIKAVAELQGIRLNRSYGLIGQEQHLQRYPEDNMSVHFDTEEEALKYGPEGMAPGLGGWGYFANSKSEFTDVEKEREKWYIAVQTFFAPGYESDIRKYVDFFGMRKMLVVNPENGKAVVVVIGDAGPAEWTGKHLGGSPEVMQYLERVDPLGKGPVLYFFVDDPENKIPLGPVKIK
ncbi:MAG: hypothetical protein M1524_02660 [Patescibacteria group bacterium]|nr:hypothetical protein [Patescibacteria group bacterium]